MNISELGVIATIAAAIVGWFVNGILDRRSARRNTKVEHLISTYRTLDALTQRNPLTSSQRRELEQCISNIQLLGTPVEVGLALEFAEQFVQHHEADLDDLLLEMRRSLRSELHLPRVAAKKRVLRLP